MGAIGSGGVNQAAVQQEQANQNQAQSYAASQQQAALAALQGYIKQNPSPASTAAPIGQPSFAAPKTMGGGMATGGGTIVPPGTQGGAPAGQPQAPPNQLGGQPGQGMASQINPQQAMQLLAALKAQFAPKAG